MKADKKHDASETAMAAARAKMEEHAVGEDDGENLQADLDRFRDLALRSQADFENYKKRAAREKA